MHAHCTWLEMAARGIVVPTFVLLIFMASCARSSAYTYVKQTYVEGFQWEQPIDEEIAIRSAALVAARDQRQVPDYVLLTVRDRYQCGPHIALELAEAQRAWYSVLLRMADGERIREEEWSNALNHMQEAHFKAANPAPMDAEFISAYYDLIRESVAVDQRLHD